VKLILLLLLKIKVKKELLGFSKNLNLKKKMVKERLFAHTVNRNYQLKPQTELTI